MVLKYDKVSNQSYLFTCCADKARPHFTRRALTKERGVQAQKQSFSCADGQSGHGKCPIVRLHPFVVLNLHILPGARYGAGMHRCACLHFRCQFHAPHHNVQFGS